MASRGRGRPTKLTPELQEKIVSAIHAGNYMETSAAYAGVSKESLYKWLKQGNRSRKGIHRNFLDVVEKALAEAEVRDVAIIGKAALETWQAAAWRLERKFPHRWGRMERVELSGDPAKPLQIVLKWSDEIDIPHSPDNGNSDAAIASDPSAGPGRPIPL